MSEQLENFIRNNKKNFDAFDPPTELWNKLDGRLDEYCRKESKHSKMKVIYTFGKVAAVFLMVLSFGFIWGHYKKQEATSLEHISPENATKEIKFTSLIESKRAELKELKNVDPQLYKTFTKEQNKLESEYHSLKKKLLTTPNQDRVVKAMIRNLQSQISLLNQQLTITNEVKQIKSKQNETSI